MQRSSDKLKNISYCFRSKESVWAEKKTAHRFQSQQQQIVNIIESIPKSLIAIFDVVWNDKEKRLLSHNVCSWQHDYVSVSPSYSIVLPEGVIIYWAQPAEKSVSQATTSLSQMRQHITHSEKKKTEWKEKNNVQMIFVVETTVYYVCLGWYNFPKKEFAR